MKKIFAILIIILFAGNTLFAQHAHFTKSGTVEYNKNMNMYALFKKRIDKDNESYMQPMYEQFTKNNPQFKVLKSTLSFSDNKTLFVPIEPETTRNNYFGDDPITNQPNTIYADYNTNMQTAQKAVFEETFLVKDTVRKFKWKITDETREIAGYTCRRANGIMLDSIYVVAFYATDIPISGGPESFNGLPGMILEVALPHENVTWVATKVTDTSLPPNTVVPPKKGKAVDNKTFWETIHKATKDWGEWGRNYLKGFAI